MKWNKFLRITVLGFMITLHNAHAMLVGDGVLEKININHSVKVQLSHHQPGKPFEVLVTSQNLSMRNITTDSGDLDYYFQLFANKVAMEKYMQGIPRPATEIIGRHEKYRSWWQAGNPFSSYLTFLNEDAARNFLSQQEKLFPPFADHLTSYATEAIPLKHELLNGPRVLLDSLKREFESTKKIFIGHVLLEPGEDRDLKTDAEVSYVFLTPFWGQGHGTEAIGNIVELAKIFRQKSISLDTQIIDTLIATALPRNPGSCRVLEKNRFTIEKEEEKFGALRRLYTLRL